MLPLRPYQDEAVQAVRLAVRRGARRILIVLATGAGKTVIAAHLAAQTKGRVLMVVNRDELVTQSVEKFGLFVPPDQIGVVQGTRRDLAARYVVASIQTVARPSTLAELLASDRVAPFRLVVVDESHHMGAKTYRQLVAALGLHQRETAGSRVLLGITATPIRTDGQSVHDYFDAEAYRKEIADLIPLGYLARIRGIRVYTASALPAAAPAGGDFDEQALALAVDTPQRNALIVKTWQEHAADRHTVVFAVNVAHAQHLAETFRQAGVAADWIAGSLPLRERRRRLQAFHDRQLQVLVNCTILTEGWDEPAVTALVMARPTVSRGLYIQMVGRGLRPAPGKTDCLVIDVTDRQHALTCSLDLLAEPERRIPHNRSTPADDRPPHDAEASAELPGTVTVVPLPWDLLGTSPFVWHPEVQGPWLEAGPSIQIRLRRETDTHWSVWRYAPDTVEQLSSAPLPFDYAQGLAEDWVREHGWVAYAAKDAAWRARPVSAKQQALLQQLGIPFDPATLTQAAASELLREHWSRQPATAKQRRWLAAHGHPVADNVTRAEASRLIEQHARPPARDSPGPEG